MLDLATEQGLLSSIGNINAKIRTSLFADDAAIFLYPVGTEVQVVARILASFGMASGLITQYAVKDCKFSRVWRLSAVQSKSFLAST
jgi:hypothetical protein